MAATTTFNWAPLRILIVDRDEQFRFFARSLFKHHRVRDVLSTAHATDVSRILAHNQVHVAFVELTHDETGVIHMLEWLRDRTRSPAPNVPVVLLARTLDRAQLAQACAFGIHGILQKPLSGDKMLGAVVGVITNPRLFKFAGRPDPIVVAPARGEEGSADPRMRKQEDCGTGSGAAKRLPVAGPRSSVRVGPSTVPAAEISSGKSGSIGIELATCPETTSSGPNAIEVVSLPKRRSLVLTDDVEVTGGGKNVEPAVRDSKDDAGIEEKAAAVSKKKPKTSKDPQGPAAIDIEAILQAHARWVESGGQDGKRANLEGADLSGRQLAGALLTSSMLRKADLSGCDFSGAEMHGVDMRNADAAGTSFVGADLAVARLRHARLSGCQFAQANLKGADLAGADLSGATMGDADLSGAILLGAHLAGADFSAVSGLIQGQLEGVDGDPATRLPIGLLLPSVPDDQSKA
ncbi:pentapeptide repeat-containing protein [Telmatospirillum sp.]|uniref:pentapeptide repeat-containing protein n=1 Tax=Telmatospirillum sp. TaxID=2079197 RepID=UPI00284E4B37|nr:pentapeptide repeat-containing protein [Telmatospirillum sp.]MDR3440074.1 pentapeptide repeat-containing protein [Telmatospirillum sp.]